MEGITNAFYGETFKYILMFGSIALYAFIITVIVLKRLKGTSDTPGIKSSTSGKKTASIEGNDMMSLFEQDNNSTPKSSSKSEETNSNEDDEYNAVFDNAINQVKQEEEQQSSGPANLDFELDDDEDDDDELKDILNL